MLIYVVRLWSRCCFYLENGGRQVPPKAWLIINILILYQLEAREVFMDLLQFERLKSYFMGIYFNTSGIEKVLQY